MDLNDLKQEIVSHLADMSNLKIGDVSEHKSWSYDTQKDEITHTTWEILEDEEKPQNSDWIEKETASVSLGVVSLEGTKLYFTPKITSEKMFLGDLVAPDSFDEAIKVLSHSLKILNICKPPKGAGQFGSMTPPFPMPWQ